MDKELAQLQSQRFSVHLEIGWIFEKMNSRRGDNIFSHYCNYFGA